MVDLREHERKTLSALKKLSGKASLEQLVNESGLSDSAVMRAAVTLQDRKMLKIIEDKQTVATLNKEGKSYARKGLPERRMIDTLRKLSGDAPLGRVVEKAGLDGQFVPIALGWIQRKKWATLDSKTKTLRISEKIGEGSDERLLKLLSEKGQAAVEDLSSELQEAVQILKGRKLLNVEQKTRRIIEITDAGLTATKKGTRLVAEVTQLTPELIISGKWRKARLQKYNVAAQVANTWPGKKHPYLQFLDDVREKLVALGFKEMTGTAVETAFFNFDALYTPQGHPPESLLEFTM